MQVTTETVKEYFINLFNKTDDNPASNMFNCDETNFTNDQSWKEAIVRTRNAALEASIFCNVLWEFLKCLLSSNDGVQGPKFTSGMNRWYRWCRTSRCNIWWNTKLVAWCQAISWKSGHEDLKKKSLWLISSFYIVLP